MHAHHFCYIFYILCTQVKLIGISKKNLLLEMIIVNIESLHLSEQCRHWNVTVDMLCKHQRSSSNSCNEYVMFSLQN